MRNRVVIWLLALTGLLPLCVGAEEAAPRPGVIRQIDIVSLRVEPAIIRRELAVREGDVYSPAKLDESRQNLLRLGLFKSLDTQAKWDEGLQGYRVTIKADDGWFLLPLPMFGSRGGETFAGLMLMERNYFRMSEGLMFFGSYSKARSSIMTSFSLPQFFLMAGLQQSDLDQYEYADGAYNSKQFDDNQKPEDFGAITNQYRQHTDKATLTAGGRLTPWLRTSLGISLAQVEYTDPQPSSPDDAGNINSWIWSWRLGKEGRGDPATQGGAFGAFGRIFGLGMAGVKDSLKPLAAIETSPSLQGSLERGEPGFGSDESYTKGMLNFDQVTLFRDYSQLTVALKGGAGEDLPPSQRLSTSQRGLLNGVYAREYRGDRIAAASAVFTRPFFRNRIGVLNAEAFGDYAVCWQHDEPGEKEGLGFNLAYRFWRFPLPIGGGATYSIDDHNWQFSFAMGGMF